MNKSEIVYKRVISLFTVAEIMNEGELPKFIVMPHEDIVALRMHPRAMDWIQFDVKTRDYSICGVRIEPAERVAQMQAYVNRAAIRLGRIDHAMRLQTRDGEPFMRREALLITGQEMEALEYLASIDRRHEGFDLPRGLFLDVHRFEPGFPLDVTLQCDRAFAAIEESLKHDSRNMGAKKSYDIDWCKL